MTLPLQCQTKIKENKNKKCSSVSTSYIMVLRISKKECKDIKYHIEIKKLWSHH